MVDREDSGSVTRVGGVFNSNAEAAAAGRMNSALNISIASIEQREGPSAAAGIPAESLIGSQSIDWSDEKDPRPFERRKHANNMDTSAVASAGSRFDITSERAREPRPSGGLNDSGFPD